MSVITASAKRHERDQDSLRKVFNCVAEDFEMLRAKVRFPIMQAAFEAAFHDYEHMHYQLGFDWCTRPYSRKNTAILLLVAASYLSIPPSICIDAVEFGLWLCCYIFFTQPPLLVSCQQFVRRSPLRSTKKNDECGLV